MNALISAKEAREIVFSWPLSPKELQIHFILKNINTCIKYYSKNNKTNISYNISNNLGSFSYSEIISDIIQILKNKDYYVIENNGKLEIDWT